MMQTQDDAAVDQIEPRHRDRRTQSGQSLTEYIVMLALVIVAVVVGWTILRSHLSAQVRSTAEALGAAGVTSSARVGRSGVERGGEPGGDRTSALPPPSLVERIVSQPETMLIVLFVLFIVVVLILRSIRRRSEEQAAEEERRIDEVRSHFRRDVHIFPEEGSGDALPATGQPQDPRGPTVL
jgi:flagellar biosynthesis/type III secretory pathway M-ring protein FliF/YscJ